MTHSVCRVCLGVCLLIAARSAAASPTLVSREVALPHGTQALAASASYGFTGPKGARVAAYVTAGTDAKTPQIVLLSLDTGDVITSIPSPFPISTGPLELRFSRGAGEESVLVVVSSGPGGGTALIQLSSGRSLAIPPTILVKEVSPVLAGRYLFLARQLFVDLRTLKVLGQLSMDPWEVWPGLDSKGEPVLLLVVDATLQVWRPRRGGGQNAPSVLVRGASNGRWHPRLSTALGQEALVVVGADGKSLRFLDLAALRDGKVSELATVPRPEDFFVESLAGIHTVESTETGSVVRTLRRQAKSRKMETLRSFTLNAKDAWPIWGSYCLLEGKTPAIFLWREVPDSTYSPPQWLVLWDLEADKELRSWKIADHIFAHLQAKMVRDSRGVETLVLASTASVHIVLPLDTLVPREFGDGQAASFWGGRDEQSERIAGRVYLRYPTPSTTELCVVQRWEALPQAACASLAGVSEPFRSTAITKHAEPADLRGVLDGSRFWIGAPLADAAEKLTGFRVYEAAVSKDGG